MTYYVCLSSFKLSASSSKWFCLLYYFKFAVLSRIIPSAPRQIAALYPMERSFLLIFVYNLCLIPFTMQSQLTQKQQVWMNQYFFKNKIGFGVRVFVSLGYRSADEIRSLWHSHFQTTDLMAHSYQRCHKHVGIFVLNGDILYLTTVASFQWSRFIFLFSWTSSIQCYKGTMIITHQCN